MLKLSVSVSFQEKSSAGEGQGCVCAGDCGKERQVEVCVCERDWEISTQEVLDFRTFIFALFKAHCFFVGTFLANHIIVLSRNLSNSRGEIIRKRGWGGLSWISIAARPSLVEGQRCPVVFSSFSSYCVLHVPLFPLTHLFLLSGWEVIAEDETKEADNHGSLTSLDISSPGMSGHKQAHGSSGAVG